MTTRPGLLHPRHWHVWLLLVPLTFIAAWLPWFAQRAIGTAMGELTWWLLPQRRLITLRNLALCFPQMTDVGRQHIARDSFHNTGIAFFESSLAWWRSPPVLATRVDMNGLDLLHSAAAQGHGVILLGAHYIHLEYIGAAVSSLIPIDTIYRPQNNAALEAFVRWRRRRIYTWQIDRRDVRMIYRAFRAGHVVWYTGDQDFGTRHAVFAPFFGVPAATVTAASRFVAANHCAVFSVDFRRDNARRRYVVDFAPVTEVFGENEEIDALTMNRYIEAGIRKAPGQYMWFHRRFKSRPKGEMSAY